MRLEVLEAGPDESGEIDARMRALGKPPGPSADVGDPDVGRCSGSERRERHAAAMWRERRCAGELGRQLDLPAVPALTLDDLELVNAGDVPEQGDQRAVVGEAQPFELAVVARREVLERAGTPPPQSDAGEAEQLSALVCDEPHLVVDEPRREVLRLADVRRELELLADGLEIRVRVAPSDDTGER